MFGRDQPRIGTLRSIKRHEFARQAALEQSGLHELMAKVVRKEIGALAPKRRGQNDCQIEKARISVQIIRTFHSLLVEETCAEHLGGERGI
jgi:hypothetical protein